MTTVTFNGTNLSTFGNVTMLDDYLDIPERRGQNQVIPFRDGAVFAEKYFNERSIIVGIAVLSSTLATLETTMGTMRALFAPSTQKTLSFTYEDTTTRTAQATVDKPIQVKRMGTTAARVVVEFTLPDPLFRLSTAIADNTTTINANPTAMVVTNPGTAIERNPTIILTGPLQNTVITNSTNGAILTYTGTIASPRIVTISTVNGEYVATDDLAANKIGNISHSGAASLLPLDVGTNNLSIADSTATTGTVKVSFYAPFV